LSVTKRNVLEQLSKQRLIEIAQALEIHLGVNKPKADFVDAIVGDRRGVWPYAPTDQSGSDKSVCSNNADAVTEFIQRWIKSESSERANKDAFIIELCDALGVGRPSPSTGNPKHDHYVFEAPVKIQGEESASVGRMDLYREISDRIRIYPGPDKHCRGHQWHS
jgi:hypothetical protein